jgi:tripartite-type tricarboxylate transporter receptor subunit TctC
VPAGTSPDVIASLIEVVRLAAQDGAFAEQAEANGYYAGWAEGADWLTQMQTEQTALAKLWESNPWLSSSGG